MFNLKDFLPKKPTPAELDIIKEMFEASVDGQAYDPDRWSQFFKPAGFKGEAGDEEGTPKTSTAKAPKPAPVVEDETDVPFDVDETPAVATSAPQPTTSNARADEILKMIRNRQK